MEMAMILKMKMTVMMMMKMMTRMMIIYIDKKQGDGLLERWLCSRCALMTNRHANNDRHRNNDVIGISPVLDDKFVISIRLKHDGIWGYKQHASNDIFLHGDKQARKQSSISNKK